MAKIIMPGDDVPVTNIRALIYGEVGVGKTTLAITARKPIVFDAENGCGRAALRVPMLPMKSYQDALDILPETREFGTIIIDTIESLLNHIDNYILANSAKYEGAVKKGGDGLTLNGFGVRLNLFKQFLDKVQAQDQDLIFVAHAKTTFKNKNDEMGYTEPIISGKSSQIIMREMTLCGYVTGESGRRYIDFRPTYGHVGKDSCDLGKIEIPTINAVTAHARPFMAEIIDATKSRIANVARASAESKRFFESLRARIDSAEGADGLTALAVESQDWPLVYKTHGKTFLNECANARGFIWDKDAKCFVQNG